MAEAVPSLRCGFRQQDPRVRRYSQRCHSPLAHHLQISSARIAVSPFPHREGTKGTRPWKLSEGRLRRVLTHDTERDGEPIARPFARYGIQEPTSAVGDDL